MLTQLELKDLIIGKIDAKNESIDSAQNKQRFIDGFLLPDNMNINHFINGERYYIVGFKGTGKTALLKYIQLKIEEKGLAETLFILFKSDFSDEDKSAFSKAAGCLVNTATDEMKDFTDVWLWYIHRQIVNIIKDRHLIGRVFVDNDDWKRYQTCVLAPKLGDEKSGLMRLLPKLKRGNIEIESNFVAAKGTLGLQFEWVDNSKSTVKFSDIVKQANTLFDKLAPVDQPIPIYIFFDELELTFNKSKQYQTDTRLIRDVIVAINKINFLARKLHFPVYTITSIRSEVLTAVETSGKEINKAITDFGLILKWPQKGDDSKYHPLMNIITKKIQASYKLYDITPPSDNEIWERYFPPRIGDKSIYEHLLNKTWYRPRDIVRLLLTAQNHSPQSSSFSQSILDSINRDYSTECWKEQIEELRAKYNESEIDGIKQILLATECPFTFIELNNKCATKKELYDSVNTLLNKYKLAEILSDLYRIGVIGNTGQKMRFSFRGDDELLIEKEMTIHPALWSHLSVERKNK